MLGQVARLTDEVNGKEADNSDHEDMPPAFVVREFTVRQSGLVDELKVALPLLFLFVSAVDVHDE